MTRAERNSWRTAIKRRTFSAPLVYLWENGLIPLLWANRCLDYGCGRGDDAEFLALDVYDPHFAPTMPRGRFACILCTYVLNTLPRSHEAAILANIRKRLTKDGVAYITVRRDIRKPGYTSRGTYQRNVKLALPIVHENSNFCVYEMRRTPHGRKR